MNTCKTCRFYAEYVSVCCNGDSEYRADFVDENDYYPEWEEIENV